MKPFTNKALFLLAVLLAACGVPSEPAAEQNSAQDVQVPPVAQVQTPAETVAEPQPVPQAPAVLPEEKPARQPAQPQAAPAQVPAVQPAKPVPQAKPAAVKKTPAPLSAQEVTARLQKWDNDLLTLETSFTQLSAYDGVEISRSQGRLYYDKTTPMLRLDTLGTDGQVAQTALTDKKQILILDDKKHPVTTLSWDEWQRGQPNQALFDFGNYTALLARHEVALEEQGPTAVRLCLTPKESDEYRLYLTLSAQDYFPQEIQITADLMTTTATLADTRKNGPLAQDTFGEFKL